jgi:Outer membrane protein beta-barrel domain
LQRGDSHKMYIMISKRSFQLRKIIKKTIIFAIFFLLSSTKAQQIHPGLKGGINASQLIYGDNTISPNSKVGLNLGVLANIHTSSKSWAIQPEFLYSTEGAKIIGNLSFKYILYYLNVPVLVQYMFENGFRLEGGPQIGFLLNAKEKVNDVSVDDKAFKSTAFSIPIGLGYLTTSGLGFDARYLFGLSNINGISNGSTIHSNVFQFGIFYQVNDTKKHSHH